MCCPEMFCSRWGRMPLICIQNIPIGLSLDFLLSIMPVKHIKRLTFREFKVNPDFLKRKHHEYER